MKAVSLLMTLLTMCFFVYGQIEAVTKEGKKVILKDDGTWKYVDPKFIKADGLECSNLVKTSIDKVTGNSNRTASESILVTKDQKNGLAFYILQSKSGSIIFSITAIGAGNCIDDKNKMNVLFRDGSRIELKNDGDFNCEAKFTLYFGEVFGKKKELEMFRTKEIETVRVWTSKGYVEEDFAPETSVKFMKTVDCLVGG